MELALGLIESKGLIGAIEAADAMTKTADVHLIGYEVSTGGLICVKIVGEVAAVKSAIEEAANRASRIGQVVSVHVIPRPDADIEQLIQEYSTPGADEGILYSNEADDLESLSVTELRRIARETRGIALKGRQISTANKEKLIKAIKDAH